MNGVKVWQISVAACVVVFVGLAMVHETGYSFWEPEPKVAGDLTRILIDPSYHAPDRALFGTAHVGSPFHLKVYLTIDSETMPCVGAVTVWYETQQGERHQVHRSVDHITCRSGGSRTELWVNKNSSKLILGNVNLPRTATQIHVEFEQCSVDGACEQRSGQSELNVSLIDRWVWPWLRNGMSI